MSAFVGEPGASWSLCRQGGSGLAMGQGGQTTCLGGLAVFLFRASGGEKNKTKHPNAGIFSSHSLLDYE